MWIARIRTTRHAAVRARVDGCVHVVLLRADGWTEKAAVALSYVSTKYGSDAASQLRHQLEIPDDFEDLSF